MNVDQGLQFGKGRPEHSTKRYLLCSTEESVWDVMAVSKWCQSCQFEWNILLISALSAFLCV